VLARRLELAWLRRSSAKIEITNNKRRASTGSASFTR